MTPSHHRPGGFVNPGGNGGEDRTALDMLKWMWQRLRTRIPPNPPADAFPRAKPRIADPRVQAGEVRITWIGHATFLIQTSTANLLTDPIWSPRASPVSWAGPLRLTPPGIAFEDLPPIDAVLLSHDHYDHLDAATIRRIAKTFPHVQWVAPLGHAPLLEELGARIVHELDWWGVAEINGARITGVPAQHWSRRFRTRPGERLWCGYVIDADVGRILFGGDSGYGPMFRDIARQLGPFAINILPVGAYEPRWFMKPAHMNPEDAVQAYADLGESGVLVPMHWGAFRLTDEDPLEPPERTRAAWRRAGLPPEDLRVLAIGETLRLNGAADRR
jgi:N-acyl-phosphatidylethanolamine-hydrolysing phospholipase D